ncbi:MAG: glycerophosphodiester phosphodiesterase family protein [Mariprofundaceae bacterium]|nr:glycerophosphodiester phosphodiesterase family protein [Mariprofundaceae bacterium]
MQRLSSFLVAHRGDRRGGVENTIAGFAAAAAAGARFAECDIQFSRDLVPLVIHDHHLQRLCGLPIRVPDTSADELKLICRPYFQLSSLQGLLLWLRGTPDITLFIEIKPPVRRRLRDASIARRITEILPADLLSRLVIISQSARLVDACAARIECPVGWVAEGGDVPQGPIQYVFMPWQRAHEMGHWQAQGIKVGLYTVNDADTAMALRSKGADLVECNEFSRMEQAHV